MKKFLVVMSPILLGACQFVNNEQSQVEPGQENDPTETQVVEQVDAGLTLPEGTECDDNDAFFAKLTSEGYERAVWGTGGDISPPYDVAMWRTNNPDAKDRLVLTISDTGRACRIIGLQEWSAPAG